MFHLANMHTNHVHVYGSSKCEITSRQVSFGTFGPAVWPNFSSLSLLWQKCFCQSKREVLRAYIFFFYNMSVAFCCLCFPLVGGPDGLRKAGERNMESVNWALQRWSNPCAITSSSARSSASSGEWVIWWDFTGWLVEAHAAGDCHATSPTWASVSGNKPSSHTSIHM